MATSAHSIPQPVTTQAPNFTTRDKFSYQCVAIGQRADGWAMLAQHTTRRDGAYVLTSGRSRKSSKGRMGARQWEEAEQLRKLAELELRAAALAAGWTTREIVDLGIAREVWYQPELAQEAPQAPQAPQEPAQAPEAPQEPAQAPEAPQEPAQAPWQKVIPWQGGGYISERSRLWTLDVADVATLKLYYHESTDRYEWLIVSPKSLTFLAASGGPGYTCYSRAERAMLLALAAVLHPPGRLPASLPPQEAHISASRQGR